MKTSMFAALLVLCAVPLAAQAPAASAGNSVAQVHSSDLGFSYSIPSDWEVVDTKPTLPAVKQEVGKTATSEGEKLGIACTQVALTARHGDPASVIVVVVLPYDCFGQTLTDKDLPAFASGVAEGMKKSFDIQDPAYGAYSIGTHSVWIERAEGTLIAHPDIKRKLETVCGVLKKGAVCWMALAADDAALQTFEHGAVTMDDDAAAALVPANAFQQTP
jgi:hypothetical protein